MHSETVISANGTRISYEIHGEGRPLVVVPGTIAPPVLYHPLADALAGQRQVVIIERRGYGEPGPKPCRFSYQVEDLLAVLSTLDEPATVFGHSFGGFVALEAAGAEQVRSLAVYEHYYGDPDGLLLSALEKAREAVAAGRPADAVATVLVASGAAPAGEEGAVAQIAEMLASRAAGVVSDLECIADQPAPLDEWAKITVPTLLMCGGDSSPEDKTGPVSLAEVLPHARFAELPGEGHFPQNMAPLAELLTQLD
jgi:pimeloyl-ACP methyl ester carboxylesterase